MNSAFADEAALGHSYSEEGGVLSATDCLSVDPTERCRQDKITDMCSSHSRDVILLVEFSEINGPIPLLTIPLAVRHDFNIKDFCLKIVCSDCQANSSGHFRFSSDKEVLQTDVIEGIHAYVHYFSLSDVSARGFVRPLCLAYISPNRAKLESNVSILRDNFLKVSTVMKYENRGLFLEEVSLNLLHLKDIRNRYFQWKQNLEEGINQCSQEDDVFHNIDLNRLYDQQTEFVNILHSEKTILVSEEVNNLLSCWRSKLSTSEVNEYVTSIKKNLGSKPVILCQKASVHQLHQLKPIAIISPFGIAIGIWSMCLLHRYLEGCPLELKGDCFWNQGGDEARKDEEFIQLLLHMLPSKTGLLSGNNQHDSIHLDQENVKVLHFFKTFSKVTEHILYSFLIGRTVVIAGSNSICHKVLNIISGLLYFVPAQKDSKYLSWHKGILIPAHNEVFKLVGLYVRERLAVHDLNTLTILDVKTNKIFGPAYSGMLLSSIEEDFHKNFVFKQFT